VAKLAKSKTAKLHRQINNLLSVAVIGVGLYLIAAPLIPAVQFWWHQRYGFEQAEYVTAAINSDTATSDETTATIPDDNRLAIPSIGLNEAINEGTSLDAASTGPWRLPHTSTPPAGSNTVIAGHRFSYEQDIARPFYNLDKVNIGDTILVFWQKQAYHYRVSEKLVVTPNQVSVEAPTVDSRLTLYTCTPLWTSQNRLVIVATLEANNEAQ
jgi:LPXTG-site transpeptidase (sortase) family protein